MTAPSQTCTLNARHFPNDSTWQKHCEKMARYWAAKEEGEKK